MAPRDRIAVIGVGLNSLRLVVYDRVGRSPLAVFNEKVLCGLGRGLGRSGRLNADAIAPALANLQRFVALARAVGVTRLDIIATAAVRDASDGAQFVAEATRRCGIPINILDGGAERRPSALGVVAGIPRAEGVVGDLGGGSVELIPVDLGQVGEGPSLPLGPLRLAEYGDDEKRLRDIVDGQLASIPWLRRYRGRSFYLVGGAWRAPARLHKDPVGYTLHMLPDYVLPRRRVQPYLRILQRASRLLP